MPSEPALIQSTARVKLFSGPPGPSTAATTRAALSALPADALSPELLDDAQLVVTELLTNAVRAGASWATAEVLASGETVEVSVRDDAPGIPRVAEPSQDEAAGRGLRIIEEISEAWGFQCELPIGKTVWALLRS